MKQLRYIILFVGLIIYSRALAQSDTLSFLHVTDPHMIFNLEFYAPEIAKARQHYGKGVEPLLDFLNKKPDETQSDMVVITGDLVDYYLGELPNGSFFGSQVEQAIDIIRKAHIPVYYTLGNHDIATYFRKGDRADAFQAEVAEARATWIRNAPYFAKGTWYSRLFDISGTHYRLIFLDNAYNEGNDGLGKQAYICDEQQRWLKEQIEQDVDDIEIILTHIPFSENYAEDTLYTLLSRYPSVKLIVAGHEHQNKITTFREGTLTEVQTGAFGRDTANWRLIRLTKDQLIISNAGNTNPEKTISINF